MISKELLNEVLGYEASYIQIVGTKLCFSCHIKGGSNINIYELAHKCKEWAFNNGYYLNIYNDAIDVVLKKSCKIVENITDGSFKYSPTLVFKACQWILDNKGRQMRQEQVLAELDAKEKQELSGYNNKNLMQRDKQNNGGSSDWYSLPANAKTLQDLIEHRNMNGAVKDIFKACYRLGIKTEDELRDLNKTAYYALREIGRVSGRKDYITIAKELIGSQAIEKK